MRQICHRTELLILFVSKVVNFKKTLSDRTLARKLLDLTTYEKVHYSFQLLPKSLKELSAIEMTTEVWQ